LSKSKFVPIQNGVNPNNTAVNLICIKPGTETHSIPIHSNPKPGFPAFSTNPKAKSGIIYTCEHNQKRTKKFTKNLQQTNTNQKPGINHKPNPNRFQLKPSHSQQQHNQHDPHQHTSTRSQHHKAANPTTTRHKPETDIQKVASFPLVLLFKI